MNGGSAASWACARAAVAPAVNPASRAVIIIHAEAGSSPRRRDMSSPPLGSESGAAARACAFARADTHSEYLSAWMSQVNATRRLRGRAARETDAESRKPFAVTVGGYDGVGDEIRDGRRRRAVGLDPRQVPEVTGVAVRVTGGLCVDVVIVERDAQRRQRDHDEQRGSRYGHPLQRHHPPIEAQKARRSQARPGCTTRGVRRRRSRHPNRRPGPCRGGHL